MPDRRGDGCCPSRSVGCRSARPGWRPCRPALCGGIHAFFLLHQALATPCLRPWARSCRRSPLPPVPPPWPRTVLRCSRRCRRYRRSPHAARHRAPDPRAPRGGGPRGLPPRSGGWHRGRARPRDGAGQCGGGRHGHKLAAAVARGLMPRDRVGCGPGGDATGWLPVELGLVSRESKRALLRRDARLLAQKQARSKAPGPQPLWKNAATCARGSP